MAFEVRPNASDPDINVQIVDRIYECGNEDHTAGCTLQPVRPEAIPETVEFEVRRDLSAASTVAVMKHELGHILGLDHGDRPRGVMAAELSGSVRDRPDASERAVPWNGETLRVAVDVANVSAANRSQVRTQVDHALAYYDRGADGTVPANLSFERVDAGTDADVRVTVRDTSSCETGRPVCVTLDGTDVDGDDALERYTALTVTVGGVESDAVGWYVARGLAPGLGLQADDLPPPLSDASAADRRRAWWD